MKNCLEPATQQEIRLTIHSSQVYEFGEKLWLSVTAVTFSFLDVFKVWLVNRKL